jgi:hypothetical protein
MCGPPCLSKYCSFLLNLGLRITSLPNRIRVVSLRRIRKALKRLITIIQEPFPTLETLHLVIGDKKRRNAAGASQYFFRWIRPTFMITPFRSHSISGLVPRLLSSSIDLVNLQLYRIPHSGYISPEAVATSVSALTRLTYVSIGFESPASRPIGSVTFEAF